MSLKKPRGYAVEVNLLTVMAPQIFQRLAGRSAIVTASTQGIGFSIARRLAEEGAKVIISSRKKENVEQATEVLRDEGLDVTGLVCHVSNSADRAKLLDAAAKNNGLDILVSSAGINPAFGPMFECTDTVWNKMFDINVKSSYLLTKEALPLLKQSKYGRVIYNSSYAAFTVVEDLAIYGMTKATLCTMTKYAAWALGKHNITVNSIVPGLIDTKFSDVLIPASKDLFRRMAIKRFGIPEEISGVAAFLASDDAGFISGENIIVSGGGISRL